MSSLFVYSTAAICEIILPGYVILENYRIAEYIFKPMNKFDVNAQYNNKNLLF